MVKRVRRSRAQMWAIAIAFFWILAVAVPSHTRTAPAGDKATSAENTKENGKCLVEKNKIEEYAKCHVDNNMPMQTGVVVNRYDDKNGGEKNREIAKIYEEEYDRLNKKKKSNRNDKDDNWKEEIKEYAERHVDNDTLMQTGVFVKLYSDKKVGLTTEEIAKIYEEKYIEKEIEKYAERHVDNDTPMQTEVVVNLYRDNKVGLTPTEIAKRYEEKYDELNEKKKLNIWENLNPSGDWIVACILFVGFLFQDVLRELIGSLIKAIVSRPWNWFMGSPLYHSRSLRRYRKALRDKYQNQQIPFGSNIPLTIQDVYIPRQLTVVRDTNQIDAYKAVNKYQKMVLIGPPGSGKSMLLKHIILGYANGSPDKSDRQRDLGKNRGLAIPSIFRIISKIIGTLLNGESKIVILLEMHELSDPNKSLKQHLVEALERDDFPNAEQFVSQGLNGGRLMLLLDGLDEVNKNERPRVVEEIRKFLDYLGEHHCQVIITCRTAIYESQFHERVYETLKVVEFKDEQIHNFLAHWTPFMANNKSSEQLMKTLRDLPQIMPMARNPLLLTIIANIYTNSHFVLPNSRVEFYQEATRIMLKEWHQKHNQYRTPEKLLVLEHLGLYFQDNANQQQQDRRSMDYEQVLTQVKDVLPRLNLNSEDVKPLLKEIVERSGLFLEIDGGERYQFTHLTLQEFFAAAALRKNPEGIVDRFKKDPDAWRETTKLWCGLAEDSTEVIENIYAKYPIIAFECLADAKKVNPDVSAAIIDTLKKRLSDAADIDDPIIEILAEIAVENSPDGLDMFNFLEEKLYDRDLMCRAAAKALSLTNLPKAARVLASHYNELSEVREHLLAMGDLAVPELVKLCQEEPETAARNALRKMKTPKAEEAWHKLKDEGG